MAVTNKPLQERMYSWLLR